VMDGLKASQQATVAKGETAVFTSSQWGGADTLPVARRTSSVRSNLLGGNKRAQY
jgi:hypothetical protein